MKKTAATQKSKAKAKSPRARKADKPYAYTAVVGGLGAALGIVGSLIFS
jgi:hypothetical protein